MATNTHSQITTCLQQDDWDKDYELCPGAAAFQPLHLTLLDAMWNHRSAWRANVTSAIAVFYVSAPHFDTNDPPLWAPPLAPADRSKAFMENRNKCLNCRSATQSMETCTELFRRLRGLPNPALGELDNDGRAGRRWQSRMKSIVRAPHPQNRHGARGGSHSKHYSVHSGRSCNGHSASDAGLHAPRAISSQSSGQCLC